jgi:hypothetical protein
MKRTHLQPRHPRKRIGFCWSRSTHEGATTWRLFRRDHRNAVHMALITIGDRSRGDVARTLQREYRKLRDKVDEINLLAMGVAA